MLIKSRLGNLATFHDEGRAIDRLQLEWNETERPRLLKRTGSGREVALDFTAEAQPLKQDDVLYADDRCLVVVEVIPCEVIVLQLSSVHQVATASYQIGSRRLPLFYEENTLLVPYDTAAYRLLQEAGFEPQLQKRKLLHRLRTTAPDPSQQSLHRDNFFSRIFRMSTGY